MRGRARTSRGEALAALCVLAACGFLGSLASAAFAAGNPTLNGPGELRPMRLALGDLTIGPPAGCSVAYTLQVLTEVGTGSDEFELQVYDDGALTQAPPTGLDGCGARRRGNRTFRGTARGSWEPRFGRG